MLPPYCAHRQHKQCACTFAAPTCARLVCNEFNHRHTHKHVYKCIYTHASKHIKIQTYMQAHRHTHKTRVHTGWTKIPQYFVTKIQTHPDKTINPGFCWNFLNTFFSATPKEISRFQKTDLSSSLNLCFRRGCKDYVSHLFGAPCITKKLQTHTHAASKHANTHWHESKHKKKQAYRHESTHIWYM